VRRAGAIAGALLFVSSILCAQSEKLEAEAKRAFDSGRFREAAEKYAKAAESPDAPAERKGDFYLNSAWSFYIAGNSKGARDNLRAAYSARPDLVVVGDLYSPDFARLAQSVRAEIAGTTPLLGPAELRELKRSARGKLTEGRAEEALAELKPAAASNDPEVQLLLAEIYEKLGRGAEADAARQRASDLQKGLVTSTPISGSVPGAGATAPLEPAVNVTPLLDAADKALKAGDLASATRAGRASRASRWRGSSGSPSTASSRSRTCRSASPRSWAWSSRSPRSSSWARSSTCDSSPIARSWGGRRS